MTKDTSYFGKVTDLETRLTDLKEYLSLVPAMANVLEIGCAEGEMSEYFFQNVSCYITAFDKDPNKIDTAIANCSKGIVFSVHDVVDYPLQKFDVIFYLGVHHKLPTDTGRKVLTKLFENTDLLFIRTPRHEAFTILDFCSLYRFKCIFHPSSVEGQGPLFICHRL